MIRWTIPVAAYALAAPAMAQPIAAGVFTIGGERFAPQEIIDARAIPDSTGRPAILITFTPNAAARIRALTAANIGKPLAMTLDGETLAEPVVREAIAGDDVTISGNFDFATATALAKRISGKEPVPEEFEE